MSLPLAESSGATQPNKPHPVAASSPTPSSSSPVGRLPLFSLSLLSRETLALDAPTGGEDGFELEDRGCLERAIFGRV